jgi:fimbrial chaperone protein
VNHLFKKLLYIFLTLLWESDCYSADMGLQPLGAQLSSRQPIASFTLTNRSSEPMLIQTHVYAWTQQQGQDIYNSTHDLLVTPPIISIPPGQEQLLRIGWLNPFPQQQEQAYRLYIQQISTNPSIHNESKNGVMISLRIGLPVFIQPTLESKPQLSGYIQTRKNNQIRVSIKNTGNAHAKIVRIELVNNEQLLPVIETFKYILPHQTQSWLIKKPKNLQPSWRLMAITDLGIQIPIVLAH